SSPQRNPALTDAHTHYRISFASGHRKGPANGAFSIGAPRFELGTSSGSAELGQSRGSRQVSRFRGPEGQLISAVFGGICCPGVAPAHEVSIKAASGAQVAECFKSTGTHRCDR